MANTKEQQNLVAKRFFNWLRDNRISVNKAAETIGVGQNTVSNWRNRGIPTDKYKPVADMMGLPIDVLVAPAGELDIVEGKVHMLPLVNEVHAGAWTGVGDLTYEEYFPVTMNCSRDSFCLKVQGNSMYPVFVEGDVLAVDPAIAASAGRYVVATKGDEPEATVKKYRALGLNSDGVEVFELIPANPDYASYRSDQVKIRIVGVVFSVIRSV